jgi:phage tail-like protein
MLLDLNDLTPEVYRSSRDFKVFLRLLEYVISSTKYDIDNWLDLYNPMKCPIKFLSFLADLIGYKYNTSLSVEENRIIMSKFVEMIKNKGSDIGIRMAAALSLNAQLASDPASKEYQDAVNLLQQLETYYDKDTGVITIYYPKDLRKVRDLLYYVRPVGSFIEYVPAVMSEPPGNNMGIYTEVDTISQPYDNEKSSKINHAQIGLSKVSNQVPMFAYNASLNIKTIDSDGNITRDETITDTVEAIDRYHAISLLKKRYKGSTVTVISCKKTK